MNPSYVCFDLSVVDTGSDVLTLDALREAGVAAIQLQTVPVRSQGDDDVAVCTFYFHNTSEGAAQCAAYKEKLGVDYAFVDYEE